MAQLTLCIPGFKTYLLSLTFHIRSGEQSNISVTSESSQRTEGRQEKPRGAAELGDPVSGLGTGPGSGSPLQSPPRPQGPSLVLGAPGAVVGGNMGVLWHSGRPRGS